MPYKSPTHIPRDRLYILPPKKHPLRVYNAASLLLLLQKKPQTPAAAKKGPVVKIHLPANTPINHMRDVHTRTYVAVRIYVYRKVKGSRKRRRGCARTRRARDSRVRDNGLGERRVFRERERVKSRCLRAAVECCCTDRAFDF